MIKTIPFTYLIKHIPTNKYYYGVRFRKNCNPNDLWTKYFTSSKKVKLLIKKYGKKSFIFEIRKIFKTCSWGYFSNDLKKGKGNEISLLRTIYKNEGWEISSKRKICNRNNEKKLLVELHFNKYS